MGRTELIVALIALVASGGCKDDSSALDEAFRALQGSDASRAIALVEPYRATLDPQSAEYGDATLLYCEALASTAPERVEVVLGELAESRPSDVDAREWDRMAAILQERGKFEVAAHFTHAGLLRWPEDPRLVERIDALRAIAANGGQTGLMEALRGLGYFN
jgi:hypothetical protein